MNHMTVFWLSYAVLWALVAIQGFAFLELLRQVGQIRRELGPKQGALIVPGAVDTGATLPELSGLGAADLRPARWDSYLGADQSLAIFLTTRCVSCRTIAEDLSGFAIDVRREAGVVVVVEGSIQEVSAFIREAGLDQHMVVIDEKGATSKRLGITWSPAAVTIKGRQIGDAAIVNSIDQIHALIHDKRSLGDEVPV